MNDLFDALNLKSNHDDENHHKIHESLKLAFSIINSATDVIIICEAEPIDEPGPRIVYVNDVFEKNTGYSAEEVLGKTPRILQGPKTSRATLRRILDAMEKWQPICEDILNHKKNGEEFWINLSIFPIADKNGKFTHWVSIQRNIKDSKQHETTLLSAKADLLISKEELTFQNEEEVNRTDELLTLNAEINQRDLDLRFILDNSPIAIRMTNKVTG